jgi:glycosyltransferase involved in cell wall biosynthesis
VRAGVDASGAGERHGDGRYVRNIARALLERAGAVEYTLVGDPGVAGGPPSAHWRAVQRSGSGAAGGIRSPRELAALVRAGSRQLDCFLSPTLSTYFPVLGVPAVVGVHDAHVAEYDRGILPRRRARLAWAAKQRLALARAERVFTVSHAARDQLASHLGLDRARIAVVPSAPDPVFGPRSAAVARRSLERLGADPGRPTVVYAAGINPRKRPELLCEALAELRARGTAPVQAVICGALEDDTSASAAPALRRRIEALELAGDVILPGFVGDELLAGAYSAAAAAVVCSPSEGFGFPAVEAAACGAPVVATDIPAHRETVGDGAALYPPGDASALADELERLSSDPAAREQLSAAGRKQAASLSWERAAASIERLLVEAAGD